MKDVFAGTAIGAIAFGNCLAMIVSHAAWNSIPWAILHGTFGWGYVVYHAIRHLGN